MNNKMCNYGICLTENSFNIIEQKLCTGNANKHYISNNSEHLILWEKRYINERFEDLICCLLADNLKLRDFLFLRASSHYNIIFGGMSNNSFMFKLSHISGLIEYVIQE